MRSNSENKGIFIMCRSHFTRLQFHIMLCLVRNVQYVILGFKKKIIVNTVIMAFRHKTQDTKMV